MSAKRKFWLPLCIRRLSIQKATCEFSLCLRVPMDTPADCGARTGRTSSLEYASHYFAGRPVSSEVLFGQRHNFVVKFPLIAVIYRYKPFPAILRVFFFTDNSRIDERGNGSGYRWSRHFKDFADFCITRGGLSRSQNIKRCAGECVSDSVSYHREYTAPSALDIFARSHEEICLSVDSSFSSFKIELVLSNPVLIYDYTGLRRLFRKRKYPEIIGQLRYR